jgi:hypothetical protein
LKLTLPKIDKHNFPGIININLKNPVGNFQVGDDLLGYSSLKYIVSGKYPPSQSIWTKIMEQTILM